LLLNGYFLGLRHQYVKKNENTNPCFYDFFDFISKKETAATATKMVVITTRSSYCSEFELLSKDTTTLASTTQTIVITITNNSLNITGFFIETRRFILVYFFAR